MATEKANPGDKVKVKTSKEDIEGTFIQSPDNDVIVVKLGNGYNVGISRKDVKSIEIISKYKAETKQDHELKQDKSLPVISILHTGGTIASKVDYRTGGVSSKFTPKELEEKFPEVFKKANIRSKLVFQMFSEDMEPEHWKVLAEEVAKEIDEGAKGIIITHGTDTMQYTANALSFMLENLNVPVIIVGAQRSSDRPSSDAYDNIICAVNFMLNTDFAGIGVCMHKNMADDVCLIHKGVKVRKLHSSRRDAFKSVNDMPIAEVTTAGAISILNKNYSRKSDFASKKLKLLDKIEKKVAIVKIHPGFDYKILEFFEKEKYNGIILEGTGLGHMPINTLDKNTEHHNKLLKILQRLCDSGMVVVMTSQTIFGRINMSVYSTGRDLMKAGVIPGEDMSTETAFVKLSWLLANYPASKVKELMATNMRGEISERINPKEFVE